jgi:hypothetical protein
MPKLANSEFRVQKLWQNTSEAYIYNDHAGCTYIDGKHPDRYRWKWRWKQIPQMPMHNGFFRYIFGAVRWVKQVCNCPRRLDGQVCVMESQPLVVVGSWLRVSAGNFSNSSQPCTCFVLVSCPRHDSTACVNASLAAVTRMVDVRVGLNWLSCRRGKGYQCVGTGKEPVGSQID